MADLIPAKAGDAITLKARKKLGSLMRVDAKYVQAIVKPKAPGNAGQWLCVTCGEPFANNLEAHFHSGKHPKHKFAWRNFETGDIEEP